MPSSTDAARKFRTENHHALITSLFEYEANMTDRSAWDDALVVVYVTGGSSDHGRVHRASCSAVSAVANARTYKKHGGAFPVRQEGISEHSERCRICGTDTLPARAVFWGDTDAIIADRLAERAHADRIYEYQRSMAAQVHAARNKAIAEVLAAHASEVDALAEAHQAHLQAEIRARYADVADQADPSDLASQAGHGA